MKKISFYIVLSAVIALLSAGAAFASDEAALDKEAGGIDKTAGQEGGEKAVVGKIEKRFNVTEEQINSLRNQKLGYGEITVVYSLASKMEGGITDANVQKIMSLREGPPKTGWGNVAKDLGLKLGPAVSSAKNVNAESRKEMKKSGEAGKHKEKHEKAMKHEKMEKRERMEKHEMRGGMEKMHSH